MEKTSNKRQHKSGQKERIIQAAILLFARQGFAETGTRELAAEADVNLSMVNYYFGSKKELLKVILENFFAGYLVIARKELSSGHDLQVKIECFINRSVSYYEAERNSLIITLSELPHDDPEIVEFKANWGKQMVEIINQEICQPLASGGGQYIHPAILAPMLTFTMASRFFVTPVVKQMEESSPEIVSTEIYAKTIVGILLQGITGLENKTKM